MDSTKHSLVDVVEKTRAEQSCESQPTQVSGTSYQNRTPALVFNLFPPE